MITNSPRPLQNRIFTPLKETTVNFSPHSMMASLQMSSFSEQKIRNSHIKKSPINESFHFSKQNSNENSSQSTQIEKKEKKQTNHKEVNMVIMENQTKAINVPSKTKSLDSNAVLCQKFNILLEKNETLNEVLEKKIKNLHKYSKENSVLSKEIAIVQKENAELQLELEANKIKISILENESKEKEGTIEKLKNISSSFERETKLLRQEQNENRENFEKLLNDYENKLNEKNVKVEESAKTLAAKKKLEGQLLIFIKETEKLTKIIEDQNNHINIVENRLNEFQSELNQKNELLSEKESLISTTIQEMENMSQTLSKQSEIIVSFEKIKEDQSSEINSLQKSFENSLQLLTEKNRLLKEDNGKLETNLKTNEKKCKTLEQKIEELQTGHLNLAKAHTEKILEYQKSTKFMEEEIKKLKSELKTLNDQSQILKENISLSENVARNLQIATSKLNKENEMLKKNEDLNLKEIENLKKENFELNEKIKIKAKGYSILKSHFYSKYEETIKLLIQKDKELERYSSQNKENHLNYGILYEDLRKKQGETNEISDFENEISQDLISLNQDCKDCSVLDKNDANL